MVQLNIWGIHNISSNICDTGIDYQLAKKGRFKLNVVVLASSFRDQLQLDKPTLKSCAGTVTVNVPVVGSSAAARSNVTEPVEVVPSDKSKS